MQKINEELLNHIIKRIKDNSAVTESYLAKETFYSERTIRRYFKILKDRKAIRLIGSGKKRSWKII